MAAEALLDPLRERVLEGMRTLPFEEIYEVGGSLRDQLLGRPVKDVDFLVRGHGIDELVAVLRRYGSADELRVAGRLVGVRFRPPFGPKEGIEVVAPRREQAIRPGEPDYTGNPHTDFRIEPDPNLPVRDDLERRDFTVNAMARDIRSGSGSTRSAVATILPPASCAPCTRRPSATTRCASSGASRAAPAMG